jgi:cytolysin (calcineurin-like family phosphatase)
MTTHTERLAARTEATNAANRTIQQLRQARATLLGGVAAIEAIQAQYAPVRDEIDIAAADANATTLDLSLKAESDALTADAEMIKATLSAAAPALGALGI